MKSLPLSLAIVLGITAPALAETCGSDSSWSIGGPAFGEDASDYAAGYPQCTQEGGQCEFTDTAGVTTVLTYDDAGRPYVTFRRRSVRPGETLALGVLPTDTPDQAMAKVKAAGVKGLWGKSMHADPASVAAVCGQAGAGGFMLQFMYDSRGSMIAVSEAWMNGRYLYMEDPTLGLSLAR